MPYDHKDKQKYSYYYEGGYKFVFKYDELFPDVLHIWARHTKAMEDAVRVWFDGESDIWNWRFSRFETFTEREGLYWI